MPNLLVEQLFCKLCVILKGTKMFNWKYFDMALDLVVWSALFVTLINYISDIVSSY